MPPFDWAEGDDITTACAAAIRYIRTRVADLKAEVAAWDLRDRPWTH